MIHNTVIATCISQGMVILLSIILLRPKYWNLFKNVIFDWEFQTKIALCSVLLFGGTVCLHFAMENIYVCNILC